MCIQFYSVPRSRLFSIVKTPLLPAIVIMASLLSGCESKWENMPDDELAAKAAECLNMNEPAPAMIQACKNYQRECERRAKAGRLVCY